jgi:hypothetical protein
MEHRRSLPTDRRRHSSNKKPLQPSIPKPVHAVRHWLMVPAMIAAVGVGGGCSDNANGQPFTQHNPSGTDEAEIRAASEKLIQAYNAGDSDEYYSLMCKARREEVKRGFDPEEMKEQLLELGQGTVVVDNIKVTDDAATADEKVTWERRPNEGKTIAAKFVREDGTWKPCD